MAKSTRKTHTLALLVLIHDIADEAGSVRARLNMLHSIKKNDLPFLIPASPYALEFDL